MHSLWSVYESAPAPHPDTYGATIDNDHLLSFSRSREIN